ncbi:MAG: hypothetical protein R3E83_06635 [Burkholderiaceae bacterium]
MASILVFVDTANITGSWNAATGVLALSGADTLASYQAALRSVTYQNLSDDPSTLTRTVAFAVDDGAGANSSSNTLTRDITVTAVNDAPVLAAIEGTPLAVTENDPATVITASITVADADHATLTSASVSVAANYVNGEDLLAFADTANITGAWNAATGVLTLSGVDTVAAYQAALRSVTYQNLSDDPSTLTRTVSFSVDDGAGANSASNILTRDITVAAVNDAPVLAAIEGAPLPVTENDPAAAITASLVVNDADSPNLASATVSVLDNYLNGQDVLAFANTANITGSWNAATGVLTLTGVDSLSAYQAALRSVTYQNTSDNPSAANRTIAFAVDDGAGANSASNVLTRDITVATVNDAPVLAAIEAAPLGYAENDPATAVSASITVADADSPNLAFATVSVSVNYANGEDLLAFADDRQHHRQLERRHRGVLTLTGVDTVAAYQAALRSVTYLNTSDDPSALTRTVSFSVNDGAGSIRLQHHHPRHHHRPGQRRPPSSPPTAPDPLPPVRARELPPRSPPSPRPTPTRPAHLHHRRRR